MTKTEKKFKIYWSLQGSYEIRAKDRSEAVDKAAKVRDMSDKYAQYTINYVKEIVE